jgi:NhaA family Na+:H+ antiporter
MKRYWSFIEEYSLLLLSGTVIALLWINSSLDEYHNFVNLVLFTNQYIGFVNNEGLKEITILFVVNDFLMPFFFAVAGKEIWEAIILKDGSLRGAKAATPIITTLGGIIVPGGVYLGVSYLYGPEIYGSISNGWAVAIATDIAFSFLVGRVIFGANSPAVAFLLLLAVADDALGLMIIAVKYPTKELQLEFILYAVIICYIGYWLLNRLWNIKSYVPYLLFGGMSWFCFYKSGLHPALGLLPMIPMLPHSETDHGIFSDKKVYKKDTLNKFEHSIKPFVEVILFFFGLVNAGVLFSSIGEATWASSIGLLIGKPLGIFIFAIISVYVLKLELPKGMNFKDVFVVGQISGIGFTVSLFVTSVAFEPGPIQDMAKMGALFSFFGVALSFLWAKLLKIEKKY